MAADLTTVYVPVDWTAADVAEEAAQMWEDDWEPYCQGGALLMVSPNGRVHSLADLFWDEDPSWPLYAGAVWDRLVEVCAGMLNRRRRRAGGRMDE